MKEFSARLVESFKAEYRAEIDAAAEKMRLEMATAAARLGRPLTDLEETILVSSYKAGAADGARFNILWLQSRGLLRR